MVKGTTCLLFAEWVVVNELWRYDDDDDDDEDEMGKKESGWESAVR